MTADSLMKQCFFSTVFLVYKNPAIVAGLKRA